MSIRYTIQHALFTQANIPVPSRNIYGIFFNQINRHDFYMRVIRILFVDKRTSALLVVSLKARVFFSPSKRLSSSLLLSLSLSLSLSVSLEYPGIYMHLLWQFHQGSLLLARERRVVRDISVLRNTANKIVFCGEIPRGLKRGEGRLARVN